MIDPKLLTKENGFEDGVVVEIDKRSLGWWAVDLFNSFGVEDLGFATVHGAMMREFESIRPLTGRMSIWNHAPDWANYCAMGNQTIDWLVTQVIGPTLHKRPFWAVREDAKEKQG